MASIPATSAARPWLARLPPGLFGISLGLLGLAGAWRRMQPLIGEAAGVVFTALLVAGTAVLVVVFLLWIGKVVRHFDVVGREWVHPVQGPLLALLPVSTLLAVTLLAPDEGDLRLVATAVVLAALAMQLAIAWEVVALLSNGRMPAELVTPALYLPIVPGGLVGGMALAAVGFPGWAGLLFGSGTGGLPTWVAWSAVAAASAVIGFLAVRTVLLLVRGRLLPLS